MTTRVTANDVCCRCTDADDRRMVFRSYVDGTVGVLLLPGADSAPRLDQESLASVIAWLKARLAEMEKCTSP